jgi:hypothetical protein
VTTDHRGNTHEGETGVAGETAADDEVVGAGL